MRPRRLWLGGRRVRARGHGQRGRGREKLSMDAYLSAYLQQLLELFDGHSRVFDNSTHCESIDRIVRGMMIRLSFTIEICFPSRMTRNPAFSKAFTAR